MERERTGYVSMGDCRWMRAHVLVHVDDLGEDLDGVTLHAYVEDLEELEDGDATTRCLTEKVLTGLHVDRAHPELEVDLNYPEFGKTAPSTIRIHLDLHGTGEVRPGDYVNRALCTVPTQFHDRTRHVHVERVGGR